MGQQSFVVSGPTTWNSLPPALRSPDLSQNAFKRALKTYLFSTIRHHWDCSVILALDINTLTYLLVKSMLNWLSLSSLPNHKCLLPVWWRSYCLLHFNVCFSCERGLDHASLVFVDNLFRKRTQVFVGLSSNVLLWYSKPKQKARFFLSPSVTWT